MQRGTIEIITGPMFAGKTTELLRRQQRLRTIGKSLLMVNHASNTRDDATGQSIQTHDARRSQGTLVLALTKLNNLRTDPAYRETYRQTQVVMVDEAQFFEDLDTTVLHMVENDGKHVVLSGLISDCRRSLFGGLYKLVHHADRFTMLQALCKKCMDGTPGIYTRKKRDVPQTIGGSDLYETLCRHHYCQRR